MTYATIMVSLVSDQSNERCLAIAGEMVERFNARVVGIAAAEFSPPLYFTSGEQADKLIEQGRNAVKTRLSELEFEFRKVMDRGTKYVEWRSNMEMPIRFVATRSTYCRYYRDRAKSRQCVLQIHLPGSIRAIW